MMNCILKFVSSVLLAPLMLFGSGCDLIKDKDCPSRTLKGMSDLIIKASISRDYHSMVNVMHPDVLSYFVRNNKSDLLEAFVRTEMGAFPAMEWDQVSRIEISERNLDEIKSSSWNNRYYVNLPEIDGEVSMLIMEFTSRDDGKKYGLALFLLRKEGCYFLTFADVSALFPNWKKTIREPSSQP